MRDIYKNWNILPYEPWSKTIEISSYAAPIHVDNDDTDPIESMQIADLILNAPNLLEVVKMFMDRMSRFGDWDDGCFYYQKYSASELQEPYEKAKKILKDIGEAW